MNIARLLCTCPCGSYGHPFSVWITDEKTLLIKAQCVNCEEVFITVYPLAKLFADCPLPNLTELDKKVGKEIEKITDNAGKPLRPPVKAWTKEDREFFREMHIKEDDNA